MKKRLARPGHGKRGGFRTIIATNKADRWIFVYGFAKNERSTIDKDAEHALKKLSAYLLALSPATLERARQAGELREVRCHAQDDIEHP